MYRNEKSTKFLLLLYYLLLLYLFCYIPVPPTLRTHFIPLRLLSVPQSVYADRRLVSINDFHSLGSCFLHKPHCMVVPSVFYIVSIPFVGLRPASLQSSSFQRRQFCSCSWHYHRKSSTKHSPRGCDSVVRCHHCWKVCGMGQPLLFLHSRLSRKEWLMNL